jgi:hypothetical protein
VRFHTLAQRVFSTPWLQRRLVRPADYSRRSAIFFAADIGSTSLAEIVSDHDRKLSDSLSSSIMPVRPVVNRRVRSTGGKWELTAAAAVRAFLEEPRRFQARTAASMRADPKLAEQASPETIEHSRLPIAALDRRLLHPSFLTIAMAKRKGGWPL